MTLDELEAELRRVTEAKNAQYWTFTRTARGSPPDPALCRRQVELERAIAAARQTRP